MSISERVYHILRREFVTLFSEVFDKYNTSIGWIVEGSRGVYFTSSF